MNVTDALATHSTFRSRLRRGITILEVLIAAGVLAVGLLGVMALIPLIAMRLREGDVADRAAVLSPNAAEELRVRGGTEPSKWRWVAPPAHANAGTVQTGIVPTPPVPAVGVAPIYPQPSAVCIDPLGVAQLNTTGYSFPFDVVPSLRAMGSLPAMPRVTTAPLPGAFGSLLNQSLAEAVAVAEDDLLFDRPKDRTELARQRFGKSRDELIALGTLPADYPNEQTRRMAQRDFSWFATIQSLDGPYLKPLVSTTVPLFEAPLTRSYPRGVIGPGGNFLLSTVVCVQRSRSYGTDEEVLGLISTDPASLAGGGSGFLSSGVNGGDVVIDASSNTNLLNLSAGDWVMLSADHPAFLYDDDNDGAIDDLIDPPPRHRWYQVVEAAPSTPGDTLKRATLHGADWEFWNLESFTVGNGDYIPTQVTWIPSVVSVYEKSVTLGPNGTWE